MGYEVFISHTSEDKELALRICATLEAAAIPCWIAHRDVRRGHIYPNEIVRGIKSCRALVLIFTKNANNSTMVLREIERAASRNLPILTLRMSDTELSDALHFFLDVHQWLHVPPPIESRLSEITQAVQCVLASAPVTVREAGVVDFAVLERAARAVRGVVPPKEPPVRPMSFDEFIRLQLQLSTCSASTLPHPDTTSPVQNDHSARLIDELFRDALAKAPKASSTNRLAAHAGASIVSGTREDSGTALSQAPTPAFSPLADSPPSITTACADTQQTSSASGVDAATVSGHRQLARVLIIIFLSIILILILWLASQSTPLQ